MSKLPAIQFYVGDWKKDSGVQALSYHDRGVWFEILCLMHESDQRGKLLLNGAKMPEEALARVLGLDNQNLTTTLTTFLTYGVASICPDTGALCSRRMIRDEKLRQIRKEAGSKGGNPILVNQKSTTGVKQNPTPSSSSSLSSSNKDLFVESFWKIFPKQRPGSQDKALFAWNKAINSGRGTVEEIKEGVARYSKSEEVSKGFAKGAAAWLNDDRWKSDYSIVASSSFAKQVSKPKPGLLTGSDEWKKATGRM